MDEFWGGEGLWFTWHGACRTAGFSLEAGDPDVMSAEAWQRAMCNSKGSQTDEDLDYGRGREALPTLGPRARSLTQLKEVKELPSKSESESPARKQWRRVRRLYNGSLVMQGLLNEVRSRHTEGIYTCDWASFRPKVVTHALDLAPLGPFKTWVGLRIEVAGGGRGRTASTEWAGVMFIACISCVSGGASPKATRIRWVVRVSGLKLGLWGDALTWPWPPERNAVPSMHDGEPSRLQRKGAGEVAGTCRP